MPCLPASINVHFHLNVDEIQSSFNNLLQACMFSCRATMNLFFSQINVIKDIKHTLLNVALKKEKLNIISFLSTKNNGAIIVKQLFWMSRLGEPHWVMATICYLSQT